MTKQVELCPMTFPNTELQGGREDHLCEKNDCAWWINETYSTEYIRQGGMCAVKLLAIKNSEGKIPV